MMNQTSAIAEPNQGWAWGVIPSSPDGFPFIIGSAVASIGVYCLGWTMVVTILARKKVA
jgi:hypothetical protein